MIEIEKRLSLHKFIGYSNTGKVLMQFSSKLSAIKKSNPDIFHKIAYIYDVRNNTLSIRDNIHMLPLVSSTWKFYGDQNY